MHWVQLDADGRVVGVTEAKENPDPEVWLESPWKEPPEDFDDWLFGAGELVHDIRERVLPPLTPQEAIKAIYAAMPALTVGLADPLALRMADYLPDWDAGATYTLGCLAIKDGKVQRRTVGGAWREVS